ncbi:MAG TPA: c-type cytochrome [Gemmatimonadaceae bacterium]|nr:c-type cytochrome [Gemmatimonadaceae bacterium]
MKTGSAIALAVAVGVATGVLSHRFTRAHTASPPTPAAAPAHAPAAFSPPPDSAMPNDEFGKMVRLGRQIFRHTGQYAPRYTGNSLTCENCHIDGGRLAHSAPLWAAYVSYPAYRSKNGHVNTFQERMQGCFRFSMNGKAPPLGDSALVALESYAYWLATGAGVNTKLDGRGYPALPRPAEAPDYARGGRVFAQRCALCHGTDGQGQRAADAQVFPPLWGPNSYNWGAGMAGIDKAAGFIKANMPLGLGGTLSDQEAWDVAMFVDGHERPQDPRFAGSVEQTRQRYHSSVNSNYGKTVNGVLLGAQSVPAGGSTRNAPPPR